METPAKTTGRLTAAKKGTRKTQPAERNTERKVQFGFYAPDAREVYLAGEFNNWDTGLNPMKKDRKGNWKVTVPLKPGRYEYRIVVDGNWENDPSCGDCVNNEFGDKNCVRMVE